jgi:indole-3-glycerol phosphate synthase
MKDFVLEEYQLAEGRVHGADAVLLIVSLLEPDLLRRLFVFARTLGLTPLVEVHDRAELDEARALGAELIGVNSRNLRTMQVSLDTARDLAPGTVKISPGPEVRIAESGILSASEIRELSGLGYRGFLIGTSLMAGGQPGEALSRLRKEAEAQCA